MKILRISSLLLFLFIPPIISACAPNITITPNLSIVPANDFHLSGKIEYEGNPEYLPRTVLADTQAATPLTLRYHYEVTYGRDDKHAAVPLFNPLTGIGYPIGADTVVVKATLEVLKGSLQVKEYTAVCVLDKHRTIFSEGDSLSELRKKGILAVRDNIETQMFLDRDNLLIAGDINQGLKKGE